MCLEELVLVWLGKVGTEELTCPCLVNVTQRCPPTCDAAGQQMRKTWVTGSKKERSEHLLWSLSQQETSCITLKCYLQHISDQKEHQGSGSCQMISYMVLAFPPGASGPLLSPILSSLKKK